jgi:threonine synthase
MLYYSLNRQSPPVDFREAALRGQAPDKGLYFPERINILPEDFLKSLKELSPEEIGFQVLEPYVGDSIPEAGLRSIVKETVSFDIPLVKVTEDIFSLELFHGPTLAFKDIGARFMSRCLGFFAKERKEKLVVLVATSGDTGGAVAHGFFGVPGVEVVILYPSGKVSPVQEKQLTALGGNIHALEVTGNFDDCQAMVKQAFADDELAAQVFLTSANSINVARWLPQQIYYFLALRQWADPAHPPVISVPSGNFGNICAGLLAWRSGLPVEQFIAAVNRNDVIARYLATGDYQPVKAVATLSNAMDVGEPSNFIRIEEIFGRQWTSLTDRLMAASITDEETTETIRRVYEEKEYLLDPHGAVGYLALERYLSAHPGQKGIFLETAHPVKFPDSVEAITGKPIPVPEHVKPLLEQPKVSTVIGPDINLLKKELLKLAK